MADGPGSIPKPTAFWGTILAAARERATTAEVWSAIRDYAAETGLTPPPDLFREVNRMRSLAAGLRQSSEALMRAPSSDAITSRMAGLQLYARDPTARELAPLYHVRFELTSQTEHGTDTGWYTLEYSGTLPATVGELLDDVDAYAEGLAGSYGVAYVSRGRVELGVW